MNNYELTDRGKIIIAVVLIAILLVLSSVVLSLGYCSGTSPPDNPPQTSATPTPGEDDPTISNTPLPTPGSGVDPSAPTPTPTPTPDDPSQGGDGNGGNGDGYGDDYPEFGPVGLNLAEGTMQFIFAPAIQEALDEETTTMLGEFLASPKNTPDAKVQVEMPNLSEDDTEHLLLAVTSAFSNYDINVNEIVYVKNPVEADGSSFEVKLSFYVARGLK